MISQAHLSEPKGTFYNVAVSSLQVHDKPG